MNRFAAGCRPVIAIVAAAVALVGMGQDAGAKSGSGMITVQMRQNAIRNVQRYDWARAHRDRLEHRVRPYMEMSEAQLWALLPSQQIGRDASVYRHGRGCPQCLIDNRGQVIGVGSWHVDLLGRPWQVQCLRCRTWFPKNDFAAYYESALDENHNFRPGKGDPQYLVPREGVEGEARNWVEDGCGLYVQDRWDQDTRVPYGVAPDDGYQWFFAGHFAFRLWQEIPAVVLAMAELYTLTEDPEYAYRAGILLDRLADLYPHMDERPGRLMGMFTSYAPGRVMGDGWEYTSVRIPVARAYDYVFDALIADKRLAAFSQQQADRWDLGDKSTPEAVELHICKNLLIEFAEHTFGPGFVGRRGRAQRAMAVLAAALDREPWTGRIVAWLFDQDGGALPLTLHEWMGRDGFGPAAGLGYAYSPGTSMYEIATALHGVAEVNLYHDYPKLINSFTMYRNSRLLDKTQLAIGDGGSSMAFGYSRPSTQMMLDGYRLIGGPELAREVWIAAGRDMDSVPRDIYAREPEAVVSRVEADLVEELPRHESFNAGGYGLAALQAPWTGGYERAFAIYYGRQQTTSHGHADRLALHLVSHASTMMPDMGYPRYTGNYPKRFGFTRHVVSHNTVMVNDTTMRSSYSGKTRLFADAGPVRVADIDGLGTGLYDGVRTFRRMVVMVDVDRKDSYALDLFWVRGGKNHRLIQNGGGAETTHSPLTLIDQQAGTLAGPDVPYGQFYDYQSQAYGSYAGTGFQFFDNVQRGEPDGPFWIDWAIHDAGQPPGWEAHMRVHNLTAVDEIALADGHPSRGRPDRVRYLFRSRLGADLVSQFISVIEPYGSQPFIESVEVLERVETADDFAAAVQVLLKDGRRDLILVRENDGVLEAGGVALSGRVGFARLDDAGPAAMAMIAARELRAEGRALKHPAATVTGKLVEFEDSDPLNVRLTLDADLSAHDVVGRYIVFDNTERSDASFRIERVIGGHAVGIGHKTLIERLADPADFSKGVLHTISPGDAFVIPHIVTWTRQPDGVRANEDLSNRLPE